MKNKGFDILTMPVSELRRPVHLQSIMQLAHSDHFAMAMELTNHVVYPFA